MFLKDQDFIRGNCPMTKEEVRILSIAKLALEPHHKVLDIGAGTGSISIQMSVSCKEGQVIAIEKDPEAIKVIYANKEKFEAENMTLLEGEALELQHKIQGQVDRIFIGGTGGNIEEIIEVYASKLNTEGKMVLNFITLDNCYKAIRKLERMDYEVECIQVGIHKVKGKSHMLFANNPIFIISATKEGGKTKWQNYMD